jgi:hypothetical protein
VRFQAATEYVAPSPTSGTRADAQQLSFRPGPQWSPAPTLPVQLLLTWHVPAALQASLVQSLAVVHVRRASHLGATGPPQSTSVSLPFFTPSVGEGALHVASVHTPLLQSLAAAHVAPSSFRLSGTAASGACAVVQLGPVQDGS